MKFEKVHQFKASEMGLRTTELQTQTIWTLTYKEILTIFLNRSFNGNLPNNVNEILIVSTLPRPTR